MKARSIKELVEIALDNRSNTHAHYTTGKLSPKQSKVIESLTGYRLAGIKQVIDTNGIRHTLKNHGNNLAETKHGQVAVHTDDFNKIPLILKEPDNISYLGKNRLKQDVLLYQKRIRIMYFVAEAIRLSGDGNKLVFQTMYKRK